MEEYFEHEEPSSWTDGVGGMLVVDTIGPLQSFPRMLPPFLNLGGGTENQGLHSQEHQDSLFDNHHDHIQLRDFSKILLDSNGMEQPSFQQSPRSGYLVGSSWQEPLGGDARPYSTSHGTFGTLPLEDGTSANLHLGKRIKGDNDAKMPQGNEEQAQSVITNGVMKQRVRARRGQATDPHSIAERNRRERIAEKMKALQELVPDSNKTDKASMLDEIINYVKFLQMQVKCLSMCRLGGPGVAAPLLADLPAEGLEAADFIAANLVRANGVVATPQDGIAFAERQVGRLDEDMSAAMQYLQSKGLCLMPISLATAISSTGTTQQVTSSKTTDAIEDENEAMELQVFAARSGATLGNSKRLVHNSLGKETGQDEGLNAKSTRGLRPLQSSNTGSPTKEDEEG